MMLKKEGKEIYDELSSYLKNHSTFEKVDEFVLIELATYWQIFHECRKVVLSKPANAVQIYANKTSNVSGHFAAMNQCSKHIQTLCFKLGIYDVLKKKFGGLGTKSLKDDPLLK